VPSLPGGSRNVGALYGELSIPVLKSLEASVAVRYDHYSDFGGTTNPKIALRWQPTRSLLLRGSWGTGFRVPTLSDLFQPLTTNFVAPFDDPLRCPVTGSENDCGAEFKMKFGGNPQLQPEKSTQWGVGFVADPLPGLSASADYYWVEIRNLIDTLPPEVIFGDYAHWAPTKVVRKPPTAEDAAAGIPGAIDFLIGDQINFGRLQTSGVDVDVRYRTPATALGRFTLGLTGTYVIEYNRTGINTPLFPTAVGTRGPDGAVSRWRSYATLDWMYGAWGATLANTYQSGYSEPCNKDSDGNSLDASGCDTRRVGSYSVWDIQGPYTGQKNLTLSLGIRNLLDTPPPVTNQGNTFQVGMDPNYGDPRGRMYYGTVRYAF